MQVKPISVGVAPRVNRVVLKHESSLTELELCIVLNTRPHRMLAGGNFVTVDPYHSFVVVVTTDQMLGAMKTVSQLIKGDVVGSLGGVKNVPQVPDLIIFTNNRVPVVDEGFVHFDNRLEGPSGSQLQDVVMVPVRVTGYKYSSHSLLLLTVEGAVQTRCNTQHL